MASQSEGEDLAKTSASVEDEEDQLSNCQRARIERNRQKALLLRQARLASKPYSVDKHARSVENRPIYKLLYHNLHPALKGHYIYIYRSHLHNIDLLVYGKGACQPTDTWPKPQVCAYMWPN